VIIPTYNRVAYLSACLDSVFAQGPLVREVIVVDDGSPDDTGARLAPLAAAGRIRYVRQANAGLAAARNAGAALATGTYLYFLDDDDLALPDALARLVDELERHPEAAFAYGGVEPFDGEPPAAGPSRGTAGEADRTAFLSFNRIWSAGQVLIRRTAFEAVGGFVVDLKRVEDWDLWLSLLAHRSARVVPETVLAYRLHGANMSSNVAGMYRYSLRVARRHLPAVAPDRRVPQRGFTYAHLRRHHAPLLFQQVRRAARAGAWERVAAAAGALAAAWALDVGARVALKVHLARRGRWRLAADDPLVQH
jgi:glycosyltransferase involved in cell wall biosynthesis